MRYQPAFVLSAFLVCSSLAAWGQPKPSALQVAVSGGHTAVFETVAEASNAFGCDTSGSFATPSPKGAWSAYLREARRLLNEGAEVNARDEDGWTPLHWAAWGGNAAIVRLLIAHGAKVTAKAEPLTFIIAIADCFSPSIVESRRKRTLRTPLWVAIATDHVAAAKVLAANGAALDARGAWGWTPLTVAAWTGKAESAQFLIDAGATVDSLDSSGEAPLHLAAGLGHTEVAEVLLRGGGHINGRDALGRAPLHRAAGSGRVAMIELLLRHGAEVNARTWERAPASYRSLIPYVGWQTPLHEAWYYPEAAAALLQGGADANAADARGDTLLHHAVQQHDGAKLVALLLSHGADPSARNKAGETPLHLLAGASWDDLPAAQTLVAAGAKITDSDKTGRTALHHAAQAGAATITEWLLNQGVDVNAKTTDGKTPLELAMDEEQLQRETAASLSSGGAEYAATYVRRATQTVAILRAHGAK